MSSITLTSLSTAGASHGEHILITIAAEQGETNASSVDVAKSIIFIRGLVALIERDCEELIEDTSMTVSQNLIKLNNTNIKYVKAKLSLMYLRSNVTPEHNREIQLLTRDFIAVAKVYLEIYKEFMKLIDSLKIMSIETSKASKDDASGVKKKPSKAKSEKINSASGLRDREVSKDGDFEAAAMAKRKGGKTSDNSDHDSSSSAKKGMGRARSNSDISIASSGGDVEQGKTNKKKKEEKKPLPKPKSKFKQLFSYIGEIFGFGGGIAGTTESDHEKEDKVEKENSSNSNNYFIPLPIKDPEHANVSNACLDQYNSNIVGQYKVALHNHLANHLTDPSNARSAEPDSSSSSNNSNSFSGSGRSPARGGYKLTDNLPRAHFRRTHSSIELNKHNLTVDVPHANIVRSKLYKDLNGNIQIDETGVGSKGGNTSLLSSPSKGSTTKSNSPLAGKVNNSIVSHDNFDPTVIPAEPDELY